MQRALTEVSLMSRLCAMSNSSPGFLGLGIVTSSALRDCKVRSMRKSRSTRSLNVQLGYLKMQFWFLILS